MPSAYRKTSLQCIYCKDLNLSQRSLRGIQFHGCDGCQSTWISEAAFVALMKKIQPAKNHEPLIHNDGSEREKCPQCKEKMDIAWILFLQFFRCAKHGLWFDAGQLEQAMTDDVGRDVLKRVKRRVNVRAKRPWWQS